jgi:DNA-binding response OmpR family regulator
MMPYKDGYTLAKEIEKSEVPIIFLTAKSMKEDVLKGYKAGADDYLNKPLIQKVLMKKKLSFKKISDTKRNKFNMNSTLENFTLIQN